MCLCRSRFPIGNYGPGRVSRVPFEKKYIYIDRSIDLDRKNGFRFACSTSIRRSGSFRYRIAIRSVSEKKDS